MANSLPCSIRDQIVALLTNQISLFAFQEWLAGATWDIERHADPEAADLAYSSTLALAELSRGDVSQATFQKRMGELAGMLMPTR